MEYGDIRSLFIEYPNYNSFGDTLNQFTLYSLEPETINTQLASKYVFNDLVGRSILIL